MSARKARVRSSSGAASRASLKKCVLSGEQGAVAGQACALGIGQVVVARTNFGIEG
jgi:hypothetical protein